VRNANVNVVDLDSKNIDDALDVCTFPSVRNEASYRKGCEIRKKWLLNLYRTVGSCAKIAYVADKAVGAIEYTPLHMIPYLRTRRKDALYIHCIYVPRRYRHQGIGSALLDSLIEEMSKPNELFQKSRCRMLVTSARKIHGYTQVGLFKRKGFRRMKGNADVGLVLPLSNAIEDLKLDISSSRPKAVKEHCVKIFFKPTCQYCMLTNKMIKTQIRRANKKIQIEESDLWRNSDEAIHRRITCVATYINRKPILPMANRKFLQTLRNAASGSDATA
jgi:GNAT superfamily N-acetyltransferase